MMLQEGGEELWERECPTVLAVEENILVFEMGTVTNDSCAFISGSNYYVPSREMKKGTF